MSVELSDGWSLARAQPDGGADASRLDALEWIPAKVPGTVAGALKAAGALGDAADAADLDAHDWWFRTEFETGPAPPGERVVLALGGIATVAEVYLNGVLLLESDSMWISHAYEVQQHLRSSNELAICCRALTPRLAVSRRPRARWRTKLVADGNLRFFRTMILGRAPGFAPGPPVIGPWRPIRLERGWEAVLRRRRLRTSVRSAQGIVELAAEASTGDEALGPLELELTGPTGTHTASIDLERNEGHVRLHAVATIDGVARWWPHTHGEQPLYRARLLGGERPLELGTVGFRALSAGADPERDGIQLEVNDAAVFARGAVWTPIDLLAPHSRGRELRAVLERVKAAGMNMLRIPGTSCYESDEFFDLCDELGLLVWQDFMFANLDYPAADEAFMALVQREAQQLLDRLAGRPSIAVLCGGSEVAQQVAMLGLDPELARGPLFGDLLPRMIGEAGLDAAYVPSTPWGGDAPFRTDVGVANYYGVGAYLRPLEDARRAEVKFAAECLAFANVPDPDALEGIAGGELVSVQSPTWKRGVPRDVGAGWDFDDVRDHYLRLLHGIDPAALRSTDPDRYLELSRSVSGDVMAETYGEWRRAASCCCGALVLWLRDLYPGAGWGVLDHRGLPKLAYMHLRRALAPVAVWSTDEGLGGITVHVANDTSDPLQARLRVALYRDFELKVEEVSAELDLAPHASHTAGVEELIGRFLDVSWAYRFGPPAQDLVVVSLEHPLDGADAQPFSQAFRFPAGRPREREQPARLGLEARLAQADTETPMLTLSSTRLAYGVRVEIPGHEPEDDGFSLEPGHVRTLRLKRIATADPPRGGRVRALNLEGYVAVQAGEAA